MAITCNGSYANTAGLLNGAAGTAFTYMALGTGTGQSATSTTLATESVASGLTRVAATCTRVTTTVANDTSQWAHTWTSAATATITEVGVFNNATKDLGDMALYAELSPSASLLSGYTLAITAKIQHKAD